MTWKIRLNVAKTNSPKSSSLNDSKGPMAPIGSFNPAIPGITGLKVSSQPQGIDYKARQGLSVGEKFLNQQ